MKRFFFIIFVTSYLLAFPASTFAVNYDSAAPIPSANADSACQPETYYCNCTSITTTNPVSSSNATSATECSSFCLSNNKESYTYSCTLTNGTQNNVLAQGNVSDPAAGTTPTTPAEESKLAEPIIPTLNVKIPGFDEFSVPTQSDGYTVVSFLGEYISAIYPWLIGAGTLIAVVMMMLGGLQYVLSRGKPAYIAKAKTRITNAITGLILLFAAYDIAFLIDPNTTILKNLNVFTVYEIPLENVIDYNEGVDAAGDGDYFGKTKWQDCMLSTLGKNRSEVEAALKTATFNGQTYKVHNLVQTDLQAAFTEIEALNLDYNFKQVGTYTWRASVNNPKVLSFHSWGVAIDINWDTNPNCGRGQSCTYDIPQQVVDVFKEHGFAWGGEWRSSHDYMHFSSSKFCGGGR